MTSGFDSVHRRREILLQLAARIDSIFYEARINDKLAGWVTALHRGSVLLRTQQPRARFLAFQSCQSWHYDLDVTDIYQWCWLEESGQRLDDADQTHLEQKYKVVLKSE